MTLYKTPPFLLSPLNPQSPFLHGFPFPANTSHPQCGTHNHKICYKTLTDKKVFRSRRCSCCCCCCRFCWRLYAKISQKSRRSRQLWRSCLHKQTKLMCLIYARHDACRFSSLLLSEFRIRLMHLLRCPLPSRLGRGSYWHRRRRRVWLPVRVRLRF